MESLMFDAVVSGDSANGPGTRTSAGVLSLYIDDATAKKITPKSSDADYDRIKAATADLNPGDTVTLMTSDLFDGGARLHGQLRRLRGGRLGQCVRVGRGGHDQRGDGRRGQDHRHRDGENGDRPRSCRRRPCRTSPSSRSL